MPAAGRARRGTRLGGRRDTGPADGGRVDLHPAAPVPGTAALRATRPRPAGLPGTPGFADKAPSYDLLVFEFATGAFLGTEHLLRPGIYQQGQPPCPQQPGGQYLYNPRNDAWFCNRLGFDSSS